MITILHGEDQVGSRKLLETLKRDKPEVISFSDSRTNLTDLKQALESKSIFSREKVIVLENFLSGKKGNKDDRVLEYLKTEKLDTDLILWEDKELKKSDLRLFPGAQVRLFRLDPHIFRFLESLRPDEGQKMILAFRLALGQNEAERIFHMIVRQFRLLLFLKVGGNKGLEEMDKLADWQRKKLESQAGFFKQEGLVKIYQELLEIDYREKSGLAAYPLAQALELFLASL